MGTQAALDAVAKFIEEEKAKEAKDAEAAPSDGEGEDDEDAMKEEAAGNKDGNADEQGMKSEQDEAAEETATGEPHNTSATVDAAKAPAEEKDEDAKAE